MYDIIYEFIHNHLINTTSLNGFTDNVLGSSITLDVWLAHTLSITTIVLCFILAISVCRWFFRLGAGLFRF
jgi:hypothetical protein